MVRICTPSSVAGCHAPGQSHRENLVERTGNTLRDWPRVVKSAVGNWGDLRLNRWSDIIPPWGIRSVHTPVHGSPLEIPLLTAEPMKTLGDSRKSTGHRLAIVEGHLKKVRQMVDEGAYCIDIIHQSRAIQQALRKFDEQVMQQHLRTCVTRDLRDARGGSADKTIQELMEAFTRL